MKSTTIYVINLIFFAYFQEFEYINAQQPAMFPADMVCVRLSTKVTHHGVTQKCVVSVVPCLLTEKT